MRHCQRILGIGVLLVMSCGVALAYGEWQPATEAPDLTALYETIARLEASIALAESNRSAHPDFLIDLNRILADLNQQARQLEGMCQTTRTPETHPPETHSEGQNGQLGEPQHWRLSGTLDKHQRSERHGVTINDNGDLFVTVTTGEMLNLQNYGGGVRVYDSDGETRLYYSRQGTDTTVEHHITHLNAGHYYIELGKDSDDAYYGSYSIDVRSRPASVANVSGDNWTLEQAFELPLDTTVSGHLGYRGQGEDPTRRSWYRIDIPHNGHLTLAVSTSGYDSSSSDASEIRPEDGLLNLQNYGGGVHLYDSDGETHLFSARQGPNRTAEHVIRTLQAGTYYIKIAKDSRDSSYWGTYTVSAELTSY